MDEQAAIAAVVVSYRSASTLPACLQALRHARGIAEIVVVDNGSADGSVAIARALATQDERIRVLELPGNPGFAAAANAGAAASRSPWLLFVNPDLELPADAGLRLLAHAARLPRLGALGADLRDASGRRDPAARRRHLRLALLWAGLGRRDALALPVRAEALQQVEACSGALMLVPRKLFDQLGGWDAGYRLHVEDLDFCRRICDAGHVVAVANDVPVLHHRGTSCRQRPLFVEWHKHRGLWRYWCRFEGSSIGVGGRALVLVVLAFRLLLWAWPRALLASGK